jgi:hypothetical protein
MHVGCNLGEITFGRRVICRDCWWPKLRKSERVWVSCNLFFLVFFTCACRNWVSYEIIYDPNILWVFRLVLSRMLSISPAKSLKKSFSYPCTRVLTCNGPCVTVLVGENNLGPDPHGNGHGHVRVYTRPRHIKRTMHGPGLASGSSGWPSLHQVARLQLQCNPQVGSYECECECG